MGPKPATAPARPSSARAVGVDVDDLDGPRFGQHDRAIGNRRQRRPPGDAENGGARRVGSDALEDLDPERRVHGRQRVVEHEHAGGRHQRAGQGQPLALATRQREPAVAYGAVEALGHLGDDVVGTRRPQRLQQLGVVDAVGRRTELEVLPDRRGEEERLLGHRAHVMADRGGVEGAHVDPVEPHRPGVGRQHPRADVGHRRLAAAGRAHEHDQLAPFHRQVEVRQHRAAAVVHADAGQLQALGRRRQGGAGLGRRFGHVEDVADAALGTAEELPRLRQVVDDPGDLGQRHRQLEGQQKGAGAEPAAHGDARTQQDHHRLDSERDGADRDLVPGQQPGLAHRVPVRLEGGGTDARALPLLAAERLDDADAPHWLVDGARHLGPLGELGPRQPPEAGLEPAEQPQVEREGEAGDDRHGRGDEEQHQQQAEDGGHEQQRRRRAADELLDEGDVGERPGNQLAARHRVEPAQVGGVDRAVQQCAQFVFQVVAEAAGDLLGQEAEHERDDAEGDEAADERSQRFGLVDDALVDEPHDRAGDEAEHRAVDGDQRDPQPDPPLLAGQQLPEQRCPRSEHQLLPPGPQPADRHHRSHRHALPFTTPERSTTSRLDPR
jgi:hypothetical protein